MIENDYYICTESEADNLIYCNTFRSKIAKSDSSSFSYPRKK